MSSDLPLVSIVAICYNQARFAVETLESIRNQTYPNIQLIVVDDCSTDNSAEVIQNWIDEHKVDCEFVKHAENLGVTKTCNDGLRRVKGEYYQIIACDDILLTEKIERQAKLLIQADLKVALVYSDAFLMNQNSEWSRSGGKFIQLNNLLFSIPTGSLTRFLIKSNGLICAPTVLIKSQLAKDIGWYDEKLRFEDLDMWLRLSTKHEILFDERISTCYRIHNNNYTNALKRDFDQLESWFLIYWKHRISHRNDIYPRLISIIKLMVLQSNASVKEYVRMIVHFYKPANNLKFALIRYLPIKLISLMVRFLN
ncbi:MAG: glycosyltransferase [Cyclobacteriaceae bacterium]|nr:glycosyltransferase [Cyclobacteriaceae bacterium]